MIHVLSISGGKDSTAMWLWARRHGLTPRVQVAQDTGWEFDGAEGVESWGDYLRTLEGLLGETVEIAKAGTDFEGRVRKYNTFPGNVSARRWCTKELKLDPMRRFLDELRAMTGDDVTVYVGVRAEESRSRSELPEREWSDFYDCWVERPILTWSLEQVIAEHHRANVPLNPLYLVGAERVGCWPCVKAGKAEIRLVSEISPERIDRIEAMERETGNIMFTLEDKPKRCGCGAAVVSTGKMDKSVCAECGGKGVIRRLIPTPIRDMVAWSRTTRGGRSLALFHEPSGCARWGICEVAARSEGGST